MCVEHRSGRFPAGATYAVPDPRFWIVGSGRGAGVACGACSPGRLPVVVVG